MCGPAQPERLTVDEPRLERRLAETRGELAALAARVEELAGAQEETNRLLQEVVGSLRSSSAGDAEMRSTLEQLHADLSGDAVRAGAAVDRVVSETERLREAQVQLGRRVDEVTEHLGGDRGPSGGHLEALEARLEVLEGALGAGEVGEASSAAAIEQVHVALSRIEATLTQRLDQLEQEVADTGQMAEDRATGSGRLEQLEQRLQQLQDTIDAQAVRVEADSVTVQQTSQRVAAMDADVQAAVSRLTEQLESQGRSLQAALSQGLAEVRAAAPEATLSVDDRRLQALDEAVARRDADLEELHDLHATLDAGMGELRAGIAAGRAADSRTADALDEIYRRIEALSTAQIAARADQGRGRRSGKKAGESTTDAAAALAAVDEVMREQRQLREQVVSLQRTVDAAATAAARASSQAAPLAPLRTDVRVLHTQLAEQKAALETLAETVERSQRKAPAPAPAAAKKAARTTKG